MISSRGSLCFGNGRHRLTASPRGPRLYSTIPSRATFLSNQTTRARQPSVYRCSPEQLRSISLWGWPSSTQDRGEFAKVHTSTPSSVPDSQLGHDGQILTAQKPIPPSQPIPAVHHTSDHPPPSSLPLESEPILPTPEYSPSDQFANTSQTSFPSELSSPATALSDIPERIGYLKEVCGIDFGWGTSSMMEMLLEHIHIYGGFTWTTSIVLLSILTRLALLMPTLRASHISQKAKAAQPVITPLRQRIKEAHQARDYQKMGDARAELVAVQKAYGIRTLPMILPALVQIPLQFSGFRVLRNMAELPVPALETENWLWAQDLTLSDPFYILPVVNASLMYLIIKLGGESGTMQIASGLKTILNYFLPAISFFFMYYQPGAVQLYFIVSASLAYGQARLINSGSFRNWAGLHPLVPSPQPSGPNDLLPLSLGAPLPTPDPTTITTTTRKSPTKPTTTTPSAAPAGLKLSRPPPAETPKTSAPAQPKISVIDKIVNKAKSSKKDAVDGLRNMVQKGQSTTAGRRGKVSPEAERYEKAMAAQDDELRREGKKGRLRKRL